VRVGIIGAGNIDTGIGGLLARRGHAIMLSFSRDQFKLEQAAAGFGPGARAGTPAEAAGFAEVVVLATPWTVTPQALAEAGPLAGKIVWDTTNPLKPDMSGLSIGTTTSGGEEVARLAPGARVVKAIPPFAEVLHSPSRLLGGAKAAMFVCGDDAEARRVVTDLAGDIDADPVDAGPLSMARYVEPFGMLLVQLAYVQGMGARIGAGLLRDR